VALPDRQGVKLRSEPPTIPAAAVTDSETRPISGAVGCSLMSRGSEAALPVAVILVGLPQMHMHHPFRCCVAMRLRVETRDRCLSCARRSRSSSVEEIVDEFDYQSAGDESEVKSLLVVDKSLVARSRTRHCSCSASSCVPSPAGNSSAPAGTSPRVISAQLTRTIEATHTRHPHLPWSGSSCAKIQPIDGLGVGCARVRKEALKLCRK
jgi:hypothetical protein